MFDLSSLLGTSDQPIPRYVDNRVSQAGTFLTERGNTFVRHVSVGTKSHQQIVALRDEMMEFAPEGHFAFTDVTSLHMTVFQGIIQTDRRRTVWPKELSEQDTVDRATEWFSDRLEQFKPIGPFNMRIEEVTPNGLIMTGATAEDEKTARRWRDELADLLEYRDPRHDEYVFHITFAYVLKWLSPSQIDDYRRALARWTEQMRTETGVIELDPTAFCTFEDMNAFPIVRELV